MYNVHTLLVILNRDLRSCNKMDFSPAKGVYSYLGERDQNLTKQEGEIKKVNLKIVKERVEKKKFIQKKKEKGKKFQFS